MRLTVVHHHAFTRTHSSLTALTDQHKITESSDLGASGDLAFLVEISQRYHAPWIDSIRQTTLGELVLGFGFLWTDLVCYSVGIAIGALAELGIGRLGGPKLEKVSRR